MIKLRTFNIFLLIILAVTTSLIVYATTYTLSLTASMDLTLTTGKQNATAESMDLTLTTGKQNATAESMDLTLTTSKGSARAQILTISLITAVVNINHLYATINLVGDASTTVNGTSRALPYSFNVTMGETWIVNSTTPQPDPVTLNVSGDADIVLDGSPVVTPDSFTLSAGSTHNITSSDIPSLGVTLDVTGDADITLDGSPVVTPDSFSLLDGETYTIDALGGGSPLGVTLIVQGNATITLDGDPVVTPDSFSLLDGETYTLEAMGLGGLVEGPIWDLLLLVLSITGLSLTLYFWVSKWMVPGILSVLVLWGTGFYWISLETSVPILSMIWIGIGLANLIGVMLEIIRSFGDEIANEHGYSWDFLRRKEDD